MKKMPKSKNGPRSNFSFLPFDLRFRIIGMIQDGCTASVIAADPEVVKAFDALGSSFNRATMTRIKKSKEYRDWSNQRRQEKESFDADRLTSAILKENASLDTISEQTKVALLKALSDLSNLAELSDENRIKALRSITQSVTLLSSQAKDNRIAELKRKLDEQHDRFEAAEKEWQAREAELLARIAGLEGSRQAAKGMTPETLKQVEEKIKLL